MGEHGERFTLWRGVAKMNVKFVRTARKVMEEIGFVPFDTTIS